MSIDEEVRIYEPVVHGDERGHFYESYNQETFDAWLGREVRFVQDNHSMSRMGVLRGLHYQLPPAAQAKLVADGLCYVEPVPFLTVLANAGIVAGGWVGNVIFLGFNTSYFLEQFRNAYELRDLFVGLAKSLLFGFVLGVIAADEGLSVHRRFAEIGQAATRSVVYSLIGVLAADTIVNVVFYFIPTFA